MSWGTQLACNTRAVSHLIPTTFNPTNRGSPCPWVQGAAVTHLGLQPHAEGARLRALVQSLWLALPEP